MTFEAFTKEVCEFLENRYAGATVALARVTKNNGIIYTGVTIREPLDNISPTIYLDAYYTMLDDGMDKSVLFDRIAQVYEQKRIGESVDFEFFSDYEKVRPGLRCKLINYENNEAFLENVPHKEFLDLAVVPYYVVDNQQISCYIGEGASVTVRNEHIRLWDVDEIEVLNDALANTLRDEVEIKGIYEVLCAIRPEYADTIASTDFQVPMYIMRSSNTHGAIAMLNEKKLMDFCNDINCDIYIIPSSIYEVILIPVSAEDNVNMLNEMVREVNETEVSEEDVLSNHVYYFSRLDGYREAV